jgi:hypothetical protein
MTISVTRPFPPRTNVTVIGDSVPATEYVVPDWSTSSRLGLPVGSP